jgi:hypothetical protein
MNLQTSNNHNWGFGQRNHAQDILMERNKREEKDDIENVGRMRVEIL